MGYLRRLDPGAVAEIPAGARCPLEDVHRKARLAQPVSHAVREPREQRSGARWADDGERLAPSREIAVLPRIDERGKVADMVQMKMTERDVRDTPPRDAVLGQAVGNAAPAGEQQGHKP